MRIRQLLFFCLLLTLVSCKKDGTGLPKRTVLVYLAGDNGLSQETDEKIEALRLAYTKDMGRLLIYRDGIATPELLEISADAGGKVKTLRNYPEENSASAGVFSRVLNDLRKEAPASSYGLILFSHASGWLPQRTLARPSAVAQDRNDDLELIDFAAAIPDGFFDFMIFESCFMSGIEVAYELKDKTKYIVSSSAEILSPGFTPVYDKLLPFLYKPQADLKGFAQTYFDHYNNQSDVYRSATVSLIKTSSLPALSAWIKQNASSKTLSAPVIKSIQHFDRYEDYRLFFDFQDYYSNILSVEKIAALNNLLADIVIYKAATPSFMLPFTGFEIKKHSGLTIYIPQQEFSFLNGQYTKLQWVKNAVNP